MRLQAAAGVLGKAAGAWSASPADGLALQVDYLVATTHPDNRAQGGSKLKGEVVSTMREDMLATCDKARPALRFHVLLLASCMGGSHTQVALMIRSHACRWSHEVPSCVGDYVNDVNSTAARATVVCPACLCAASQPASVARGAGPALQVRWLQLRIVKKGTGPGAHEDEAFVKFVTRFKFKNQASRSFLAAGAIAQGRSAN